LYEGIKGIANKGLKIDCKLKAFEVIDFCLKLLYIYKLRAIHSSQNVITKMTEFKEQSI
jgi:hypothetical protein